MPGIVGTEWEGGIFPVTMAFPPSYPVLPPKVKMPLGFIHVNVFASGTVGRGLLRAGEGWEPSITVKEILRVCQHSLDNPQPLNPSQQVAYELFTNDRAAYSEKCKAQAMHFSEARFWEEHAVSRSCAICSQRTGVRANTPVCTDAEHAASWRHKSVRGDPAVQLALCRNCREQPCDCSDDPDEPRGYHGIVDGDRCLQLNL